MSTSSQARGGNKTRQPCATAGPAGQLDGSQMDFNGVTEKIGMSIDGAGVAVIVIGAVIAFVTAVTRLARRENGVYPKFRRHLGRVILLGLELLVAGDIVKTVATAPTLTSIAVLGGIVIIRTFLSFAMEAEITGYWPWQKPPPR